MCALPSYKIKGLDRTSLISHTTDTSDSEPIKNRHFAVSTAVEKLLIAEIDRMLALEVIEHSWALEPFVFNCYAIKPGKLIVLKCAKSK